MRKLLFAHLYHFLKLFGIVLKYLIAVIVVGKAVTLFCKAFYCFCGYLVSGFNLRSDDIGNFLHNERMDVVEHQNLITHAQGKCIAGASTALAAISA